MVENRSLKRVCIIPNVSGIGGMVTFQEKLTRGFIDRGIGLSFSLADTPYDVILVIGGTHDLAGLWRARRGGFALYNAWMG